ncbi:uncharacterized protein VP01_6147g1, partial [Puccinia sorghi]
RTGLFSLLLSYNKTPPSITYYKLIGKTCVKEAGSRVVTCSFLFTLNYKSRHYKWNRASIFDTNQIKCATTCAWVHYKESAGQYIFAEIKEALEDLPKELILHLVWCPGQGIEGNEAADRLAGVATGRNENPDRRLKENINKIYFRPPNWLQRTHQSACIKPFASPPSPFQGQEEA